MAHPLTPQFIIDKWASRALLITTALYFNPSGCLFLCGAHGFNYSSNKCIEYLYENNRLSKENAQTASKAFDCLNCVTFEFYRKTFEHNLEFYLEPRLAKATSRAFTMAMAATQSSAFEITYSFDKTTTPKPFNNLFTGLIAFIGICIKELFDFNLDVPKIGTFFHGISNYWWKTKSENFSTSTMLTKSTAKLCGFYAAHFTIATLDTHLIPKIFIVYAGDIAKNISVGMLERHAFDLNSDKKAAFKEKTI